MFEFCVTPFHLFHPFLSGNGIFSRGEKALSANGVRVRSRALITLLVVALTGALVFMAASDATAKRKKPKKNESFPVFAQDYTPSEKFSCAYLEKVGGIQIEDWVCSDGPGQQPRFFSQILTRNADAGGTVWDDKGWKYLAAPLSFTCRRTGNTGGGVEDYTCTYRDKGKKHSVPLKNTVLATSDQGEKWYLQRLPYPSPTAAP